MLAGVPVLAGVVAEVADPVRATGTDDLADRLERALDDGLALLALTIDERAIILASLEDPPEGLAELWSRPLSAGRVAVIVLRRGRTKPFLLSRGYPCPFVLVAG